MARASSKKEQEQEPVVTAQTDTPTAEEIAAVFAAAEPTNIEATTLDANSIQSVKQTKGEVNLEEQIINSSRRWSGAYLSVDDVTVVLPNGKPASREVVRHPGAVAIIALTEENKVVLVHQYRTSLEQVTVEIPAGKLTPGEDSRDAARRELEEETGYQARDLAYLGPIAIAAGYSDEIIHLYLAMGLTFVGAHPDQDEFVSVDLVDLNDMVDQILDGRIIDSKTVLGVLLCNEILRRMPRE